MVRFRKKLRHLWRREASAVTLGQRWKQTRGSRPPATDHEVLARTAQLSTLRAYKEFLGSICHEPLLDIECQTRWAISLLPCDCLHVFIAGNHGVGTRKRFTILSSCSLRDTVIFSTCKDLGNILQEMSLYQERKREINKAAATFLLLLRSSSCCQALPQPMGSFASAEQGSSFTRPLLQPLLLAGQGRPEVQGRAGEGACCIHQDLQPPGWPRDAKALQSL